MGFLAKTPSVPALPPVPPPPDPSIAAAAQTAATEQADQDGIAAANEEIRRAANAKGRSSTIIAGNYDPNQQTLGAKTLLGG